MALGTPDKPRKATASEERGIAAAVKAEAKAVVAEAEDKVRKGFTRIYPTHRLSAGPLRVSLPVEDGVNSPDVLEIDDKGAVVPDETAAHLIASRDASKKPAE